MIMSSEYLCMHTTWTQVWFASLTWIFGDVVRNRASLDNHNNRKNRGFPTSCHKHVTLSRCHKISTDENIILRHCGKTSWIKKPLKSVFSRRINAKRKATLEINHG